MIATLQQMSTAPDYAQTAASIRTALQQARKWWVARQTRAALNALSDSQLDDIGLTRAEIGRTALRVAEQ